MFLTLQVSSASISFVSSCFIAGGIIRSDGGLTSPYRRIIFGISVSDILQSLSLLLGPLAVPSSSPVGAWRIGNDFTCTLDGFLFSFTSCSTPMYMFGLCLYTALKITRKKGMSDLEFSGKIERIMHITIVSVNLILAVFALATKSINSGILGNVCLFAAFPTLCRQRPEIFGECEQKIDYPYYLTIISALGIPSLCLLGIMCCMIIICIHNLARRKKFASLPSPRAPGATQARINLDSSDDDESSSSSESDDRTESTPTFVLANAPRYHMPSEVVGSSIFSVNGGEGTPDGEVDSEVPDGEARDGDGHIVGQRSLRNRPNNASTMIQRYHREMFLQAVFFVLAFILTFGLYWYLQFMTLHDLDKITPFVINGAAFTFPFGGFFNVLAYSRPKLVYYRVAHKNHSWLRAFWYVIKTGGDLSKLENSRQEDGDVANVNANLNAYRSVAFGIEENLSPGGKKYVRSSDLDARGRFISGTISGFQNEEHHQHHSANTTSSAGDGLVLPVWKESDQEGAHTQGGEILESSHFDVTSNVGYSELDLCRNNESDAVENSAFDDNDAGAGSAASPTPTGENQQQKDPLQRAYARARGRIGDLPKYQA